jgi:hypothetical protein
VRIRPIEALQSSGDRETLFGIEFRCNGVVSQSRHRREQQPKQRKRKAPCLAFHGGSQRSFNLPVCSYKIWHGSYQAPSFGVKQWATKGTAYPSAQRALIVREDAGLKPGAAKTTSLEASDGKRDRRAC